MADDTYKRKLTTIFSTDAVGYSRLMGDDEAATVRTIELYRKIISDLISQSRGRVIDSPGDNLLAEFSSVVDAVQCAVAVQKELQSRNAELADNRKMEFRIGINLGDVIEEGDRIYGDGVNIAARLESLADPGGICISKTAFDHIESKLPLGYEYMGGQEVKNIVKPVRAYRVVMEPRVTVIGTHEKERIDKKSQRKIIITSAIVLILTLVIGIWQFYIRNLTAETASVEKMSYPLPDKPSIAVLPFVNMSGDPEQEYFSDGLTEEIITALSKVPQLFVIARNSVFTYKGKPVKVSQVAEELGVRYVLEGSVRKAGDQVRITAQLIDALSGHHLWADRYDRNLNEIFAVQDGLTKNIISAMQVKLTEGEDVRKAARGTDNLEAYLKYLQAANKSNQMNIESNAASKRLAEESISLDPDYAMAYKALAVSHRMDVWLGTSKSPKESNEKCMELLQKAISIDVNYSDAHAELGFSYSMMGKHDEAIAYAEKAVSLDPNSADAHALLGHALRFGGRIEESIPEYKKAIRLNPIPPAFYMFGLGRSYSLMGQHEEAIRWSEKAVRQEPDSLIAHLVLTMVYSTSGREEDARSAAQEVLRIDPKFSLEKFNKIVRSKDKASGIEALRKAGLK